MHGLWNGLYASERAGRDICSEPEFIVPTATEYRTTTEVAGGTEDEGGRERESYFFYVAPFFVNDTSCV